MHRDEWDKAYLPEKISHRLISEDVAFIRTFIDAIYQTMQYNIKPCLSSSIFAEIA